MGVAHTAQDSMAADLYTGRHLILHAKQGLITQLLALLLHLLLNHTLQPCQGLLPQLLLLLLLLLQLDCRFTDLQKRGRAAQ